MFQSRTAWCQSKHRWSTGINVLTQATSSPEQWERTRQVIKWVVYSLLIINWGYYIFDEWQRAQYTVSPSDSLIEKMNAYATSIDELAWFGLLFLFEIETYWLSDDKLSLLKKLLFVAVRVICYAFLAHTLYAYITNYIELSQSPMLAQYSSLCQMTDQGFSFLRNLSYTAIDASNCGALANGTALFQVANDLVVTDAAGLAEAKYLAAIDIEDAITWLGVVLLIEVMVFLQDKGITDGPYITTCKYLNYVLYSLLFFNAANWAWKGHYVYAWDEMLWIGGFAAIGMNLSDWRDELDESVTND